MANPNVTIRNARVKHGWSKEHVAAVKASRDARTAADPKTAIMEKVARGEMTIEQGCVAINAIMSK